MAMSIQRQADQFNLDVPAPTPVPHEAQFAEMLRGGPRIHANTMARDVSRETSEEIW